MLLISVDSNLHVHLPDAREIPWLCEGHSQVPETRPPRLHRLVFPVLLYLAAWMLFSVDHGEYQEKSILITTKTILEIHQA